MLLYTNNNGVSKDNEVKQRIFFRLLIPSVWPPPHIFSLKTCPQESLESISIDECYLWKIFKKTLLNFLISPH